uniref:Uncharacterized protein n=1 Tax=Panagrolaimus superbus TaxID=310955 RepID=A0A914Y8Z5_9BILA
MNIDSTNENDQDIFVDNTKPQHKLCIQKGKDGAPNRCVGFLPKKRELDGKFEESSNAKKLKLRSQSDSFYRM